VIVVWVAVVIGVGIDVVGGCTGGGGVVTGTVVVLWVELVAGAGAGAVVRGLGVRLGTV
jgi:hypothetical protein